MPSLQQQGVRVFILSEHCDVEGIESLSDKIQQASDEPLSLQLRANVHFRSPALYIYTSGTTGDPAFPFHLCSASVFSDKALSCTIGTIKIFCLCFNRAVIFQGFPRRLQSAKRSYGWHLSFSPSLACAQMISSTYTCRFTTVLAF